MLEYRLGSSQKLSLAEKNKYVIIVEKRDYLKRCLYDMVAEGNKYGAKWFMAGKPSAKGHPHHPLYLKKDSKIESFDIEAYLKNF